MPIEIGDEFWIRQARGGSRRERRRLGAMVREIQGNLKTSAAAEVPPAGLEVASPPVPRPPTSARPEKGRRRRALFGALALLGMVGLAGIVMGRGGAADKAQEVESGVAVHMEALGEPERDTSAEEPTTGAVERVATAPVPQTTAPDVEESLQIEAEAASKRERALLRVFADPWGNVWINDEKIGRAPVSRSLRPGTYKVQIGDEYPEEPKYVRIAPGESRKITLRKAEIE